MKPHTPILIRLLPLVLLLAPFSVDPQERVQPERRNGNGSAAPVQPGRYAGTAACLECHDDLLEHYDRTTHALALTEARGRTELERRGCEACHGPGAAHVEQFGGRGVGGLISFRRENPEKAEQEDNTCLTCHQGGTRRHWAGSSHENQDIGCTTCHAVMKRVSPRALLSAPTELSLCSKCHQLQASRIWRSEHHPVREGQMSCSSCHQPHGTVTQSLLPTDSPNDTCYRCHTDKRGPFLWEHAPVLEDCMSCHDPHGTVRHRMLNASQPRLCQQCHVETAHPTEARQPGSRFVIGHSCVQCHVSIHGSNHPSGFAFTR